MKQMVIVSGKGGTGKTSVTAALASLGPDKVLADCDVDAADLHLVLTPQVSQEHEFWSGQVASIDPELCTACGECHQGCVYKAIAEPASDSQDQAYSVLTEHCEGCGLCAYVCPSGAAIMNDRKSGRWFVSETRFGSMVHAELFLGEENSGKLVTQVRTISQELAETQGRGLVLVDGPPGIGCPVIASLTGADLALVVAEPTISARHDLERVIGLTQHFRIPAMAVINKFDVNPDQARSIEAFCREHDVPLAGRLPYDPGFTRAQTKGQAITEYDPRGLGKEAAKVWAAVEKYL
ncbi:MAG: 4Fe-4S dicluster domain-containing protein [Desulfovibrio sp.]|nr:MAG: 4Fe-4S dicluster domain-containing protein [Desulfovibrio sp.]